MYHCWFVPSWQVYCWMIAELAVEPPVTSRQLLGKPASAYISHLSVAAAEAGWAATSTPTTATTTRRTTDRQVRRLALAVRSGIADILFCRMVDSPPIDHGSDKSRLRPGRL